MLGPKSIRTTKPRSGVGSGSIEVYKKKEGVHEDEWDKGASDPAAQKPGKTCVKLIFCGKNIEKPV